MESHHLIPFTIKMLGLVKISVHCPESWDVARASKFWLGFRGRTFCRRRKTRSKIWFLWPSFKTTSSTTWRKFWSVFESILFFCQNNLGIELSSKDFTENTELPGMCGYPSRPLFWQLGTNTKSFQHKKLPLQEKLFLQNFLTLLWTLIQYLSKMLKNDSFYDFQLV